jgi:hypothetical protein
MSRITITKTQATFGDKTYPISQIQSVEVTESQPNPKVESRLFALEIIAFLPAGTSLALSLFEATDFLLLLTGGLLALWLLTVGVGIWYNRPRYEVRINGEAACRTRDKALAESIAQAVHQAQG